MKNKDSFGFRGRLRVYRNEILIFDKFNLIVSQGKGYVLDWLSSTYVALTYTPGAFNAIILTKNTTPQTITDTFAAVVFGGTNWISDDGVLHMEEGGSAVIDHVQGSLTMEITGTIGEADGNDPSNNHINSICLCSGVSPTTGGAGQPAYSATNNERLFARINVGDLVKTSDASYSFTWNLEIT